VAPIALQSHAFFLFVSLKMQILTLDVFNLSIQIARLKDINDTVVCATAESFSQRGIFFFLILFRNLHVVCLLIIKR
jgi:hypothetical protein